ncbi:hypothetical protein [Kitasatospora sp. NPDC057223]|uniref:hypothetical protein n=1 Tax=Kitasatospora sp. NPDC057223 TaxID=3346055 RepID=UPI003634AED3
MIYTNNPTWLSRDFERDTLLRLTERTTDQQQRIADLTAEMRTIEATAPDGYALPKPAADLLALAKANRWLTAARWSEDSGGNPFVDIQVAHRVPGGSSWAYRLTWWTRDLTPGRMRYARGVASTPQQPGWTTAPSVRAIREVIAANPASPTEEAA